MPEKFIEERVANLYDLANHPFYAVGKIPLLSITHAGDYLNFLVLTLHRAGLIKDLKEFRDGFEVYRESKNNLSGGLKVIGYNTDWNPNESDKS